MYLYDDSFSVVGTGGGRLVVGNHYSSMKDKCEEVKPGVVRKVKRGLKLMDLGHLAGGEGAVFVDGKKFGRLINALMDKLENKLGADGVRARVRLVASSQAKTRGKENLATRSPKRVSNIKTDSRSSAGGSDDAAEAVPAAGSQIPRTPLVARPGQDESLLIPRGKQIPRTPPSSQDTTTCSGLSSIISSSPSPAVRGRVPHKIHINPSDFDTPPLPPHPSEPKPGSSEAFVSRDMLARTPVNSRQVQDDDESNDSLPPPPDNDDLAHANVSTPDLPPPPEEMLQHQSNLQSSAQPGVNTVVTGRQLARTPAVKSQAVAEAAPSNLPSGNYVLPENLQELDKEDTKNAAALEEQQRRAEDVRRKKKEDAELKRKKLEIETQAKEERKKMDEEKKELEMMRKALMEQQKQLELKENKLKREEEKVKKMSRLSDINMKSFVSRQSNILPPVPSSPSSRSKVKVAIKDKVPSEPSAEVGEPEKSTNQSSFNKQTKVASNRTPSSPCSRRTDVVPPSATTSHSPRSSSLHSSPRVQSPLASARSPKVTTPRSSSIQSPAAARTVPTTPTLQPRSPRLSSPLTNRGPRVQSPLASKSPRIQSPSVVKSPRQQSSLAVKDTKTKVESKTSIKTTKVQTKDVNGSTLDSKSSGDIVDHGEDQGSAKTTERRRQLIKDGVKANIEKRKESVELVLKKTEAIKEQAKKRREEYENAKKKKMEISSSRKSDILPKPQSKNVPEQDASISSSSDKVDDPAEDVSKRPSRSKLNTTTEMRRQSLETRSTLQEPKLLETASTKPAADSKIRIGRKSSRKLVDQVDSNHDLFSSAASSAASLESPTKKLKLNEKVSVPKYQRQSRTKSSRVVEKVDLSVVNVDTAEDSPLFQLPPIKERKRKTEVSAELPSVEEEVKVEEEPTKKRGGKRKIIKEVKEIEETLTQAEKVKTSRKEVDKKENETEDILELQEKVVKRGRPRKVTKVDEEEKVVVETPTTKKPTRGRKKKSSEPAAADFDISSKLETVQIDETPHHQLLESSSKKPKRGRTRKKNQLLAAPDSPPQSDDFFTAPEEPAVSAARPRRGCKKRLESLAERLVLVQSSLHSNLIFSFSSPLASPVLTIKESKTAAKSKKSKKRPEPSGVASTVVVDQSADVHEDTPDEEVPVKPTARRGREVNLVNITNYGNLLLPGNLEADQRRNVQDTFRRN